MKKLFSCSIGLLSVTIFWDSADCVIDVIALYNHCIRYLSLDGPEDSNLITLFSDPAGVFSQLESLSVDGNSLTRIRDDGKVITFGTAPHLHTVSISRDGTFREPIGPLSFLIPFRQLINLEIEDWGLPLHLIHNILRECTSVVYLHIYVGSADETLLPKSLIPMENLESLEVTVDAQLDWDYFSQPLVESYVRH